MKEGGRPDVESKRLKKNVRRGDERKKTNERGREV